MDHNKFYDLIDDYIDGKIDTDLQYDFDMHMMQCPYCHILFNFHIEVMKSIEILKDANKNLISKNDVEKIWLNAIGVNDEAESEQAVNDYHEAYELFQKEKDNPFRISIFLRKISEIYDAKFVDDIPIRIINPIFNVLVNDEMQICEMTVAGDDDKKIIESLNLFEDQYTVMLTEIGNKVSKKLEDYVIGQKNTIQDILKKSMDNLQIIDD